MANQAVRALAPVLVCGVALFAADVWKTKDPSAWTQEEAQKVLTDSPWAKVASVKVEGFGQGGGMGRGGGGTWGGGGGGMGGGIGLPRLGGLGMPGGGMGGGGRRGGGRRSAESLNITIRWDSAAPIQQALLKTEGPPEKKEDGKPESAMAKSYVISVIGLPAGMRRSNSDSDDDVDRDSPRGGQRDPDAVREELMEMTRLTPKGKRSILPSDVKFDVQGGRREIQFFFPREAPIEKDDKEVTFSTQLRRMKVERKFNLKEMMFQGNLAL